MSSTQRFELSVRTPSTLPNVTTDHVAYVRAWTITGTGSLSFEVRQGSTVIQSWTISITATPTTYALPLDSANVATITNYGDLRLSWTGTGTSGAFVRVGKPTYLAIPVGSITYRVLSDGAGGADALVRNVVEGRTLADGAAAADALTPSETYAERTTPRFEVGVRNPSTTPDVHTDHTAYVRAWVTSGAGYIDFDVRQGTTVIQTWTLALTTTPTSFVLALDPANVATITDYSDLRLSWVGRGPGGGVASIRVGKPTYLSIPIGSSHSLTRNLSDGSAAADALLQSIVSARTLADGAASVDALTRLRSQQRSLADAAAATDVVIRSSTGWSRSLSDNAGASDAVARFRTGTRTLTDNAAASDSLTRLSAVARSLVDNSAASDSLVRSALAPARSLADNAAAADSLARSSSRSRTVADNAAATDSLSRSLVLARSLADGAAALDALARSVVAARVLADNAAASDGLSRTRPSSRTLADNAAATDSLARSVVEARSLADNAAASDALTRVRLAIRPVADNASASDSLSRSQRSTRSVADNAAASDSLVGLRSHSGTLADSAAASDSLSRHPALARSLADNAAATDVLALPSIRRTLADGAAAADDIAGYTNDYFLGAIDIGTGASGTRSWQDVDYIYYEPYEPLNGSGGQWFGYHSAWFKFTPTVDAIWQIDTVGSDTAGEWLLLSAFTGTDISALTNVAYGGINSGGSQQARMTFSVTAGVTYHFKVATNGFGYVSAGVLNWQSVAAGAGPGNNNFVDAFVLAGASGSTTGSTAGATLETGESKMPFADTTTTVWWKWVATGDGVLQLDFTGSSGDVMATVYKGTTLVGLQRVGANDNWYLNGVKQGDAYPRVRVESGATYYIQVAGASGTWSAISFTWDLQSVTVANDDFASATVITGASGMLSGVLTGASSELGEPWLYPPGTPVAADAHANWVARDTGLGNYDWGGWSRWYSWTCPTSGVYQFDTIGSGEFTLLGVFPNAPSITQLDRNAGRANAYGSGAANGYHSLVTMRCTAGRIYKIVVEGDFGGTGDFVLNWGGITPPVNDDIANAIELTSMSGTLTGTNVNATFEDGETKVPGMYGSGRSVWYKVKVCQFAWPYLKFTGYGADGLAAMVWSGPENASVEDLTFDDAHILYDYDFGTIGQVEINHADFNFATGAVGPWLYIQVDSYDGVGTSFTMEYDILSGQDELQYAGPPVAVVNSGAFTHLGYLCLDGTRRNIEVQLTFTTPNVTLDSSVYGVQLHVDVFNSPATQIGQPAIPASTAAGSIYGGSNNYALPALAYAFESTPGTYTFNWRIPIIPEGVTGLASVYVRVAGGATVVQSYDSWDVKFSTFDRPLNDVALQAIPMSGVGTHTIAPDAWGGATVDINEGSRIPTVSDVFGSITPESIGRTIWFSWTPQQDNESLFFWEDYGPTASDSALNYIRTRLTVFTDEEQLKVLHGGPDWSWFQVVIDADDPHPQWQGSPGRYNYWAVPARHDVARTRPGSTTYYVRLDLLYTSPLPLFDWNVGWFVHQDPTDQFGPDDFVILSSSLFAESDNDRWFEVGHKDEFGYEGFADPSVTGIGGRVGKQIALPHPHEETALVVNSDWPGTVKGWDFGDIDADGTVYASSFSSVELFGGVTFGVDVWDRGVLAEAIHDRFDAAMLQAKAADPRIDIIQVRQVNVVGDEVWIAVSSTSAERGARIRCTKDGAYMGLVQRNFYFMAAINAERTKFIGGTQFGPGARIWDTTTDIVTDPGLPTSSYTRANGADWLPYKHGVVHTKGDVDSIRYFASTVGPATATNTITQVGSAAACQQDFGNSNFGTSPFAPGTIHSGDVMVVFGLDYGGLNSTLSGTGWVEVLNTPVTFSGTNWGRLQCWYRVCDGSELGFGGTNPGNDRNLVIGTVWRGVDTSSPVVGAAAGPVNEGIATDGGINSPSVAGPGKLLNYYGIVANNGNNNPATWTDPTGEHRLIATLDANYVQALLDDDDVTLSTSGFRQAQVTLGYFALSAIGASVVLRAGDTGIRISQPTPTKDVMGNGWEVLPTHGGGLAAVTKLPFREMQIVGQFSNTFPTNGGIVWRFIDGNNYLIAKRTGVYQVVNGVEELISAYNQTINWGTITSGSMTVYQFGDGPQIRVVLAGTGFGSQYITGAYESFDVGRGNTTHRKTIATSGFKAGVMNVGSLQAWDSLTIYTETLSNTDHIIIDATNEQFAPWDGTYRIQDWNLTYEIIRDERYSPWFDTMSQNDIDFAIGKDGTTLYVYRWSELYEENAREYAYQMLTGNWIVTHVYAFDLEHRTYLGKVAKYDNFPSYGPEGFYQTVYPYVIMGGEVYSGLRQKSTFSHLTNRIDRPTQVMGGAIAGPGLTERSEALDGPDARIAASAGLELDWTTEGRVQKGASVSGYVVKVTGQLIGITLSAERAGTTTTTVTITRDGTKVGTVTLNGGETRRATSLAVDWTLDQKFGFTVDPGTGLYGLTVQGNWVA